MKKLILSFIVLSILTLSQVNASTVSIDQHARQAEGKGNIFCKAVVGNKFIITTCEAFAGRQHVKCTQIDEVIDQTFLRMIFNMTMEDTIGFIWDAQGHCTEIWMNR